MAGTVNEHWQLPEMHPWRKRLAKIARRLFAAVILVALVQYGRGVVHEYDRMTQELVTLQRQTGACRLLVERVTGQDYASVAQMAADVDRIQGAGQ